MSFKDYFDKAATSQALANKSAQEIGAEVESVGYHMQDIVHEERFIPQVDFSLPGNFARYGLAEEYYAQAIKRIHDEYPYDGSLEERLKWENDSTYIDLHIFDKEYPRTNGYVTVSPSGWGTRTDVVSGYGFPSNLEYIYLEGGPHPNPGGMQPAATQFTGSNYYEAARNRESNLKFDLQNKGATVEFWLKKDEWLGASLTTKEVIFDMWNGVATFTDADYGRLRITLDSSADGGSPFLLTAMSGTTGVSDQALGSSVTIADGSWHHYAVTLMSASAGLDARLYIDGNLNDSSTMGSSGINEVTGPLRAYIGALGTHPDAADFPTATGPGGGKLSGSLDEFRYWKTERTGKDIGRHWFTQVGGGTNDDPTPYIQTTEDINTNLGVYYKFNEGITGVATTDAVVLDYSGRITNGAWTGYTSPARSTGSAIVESNAAVREFKDPIIYSFHPDVVALSSRMKITGSNHDVNNNSSMYNTIPAWMMEEDTAGQGEIKHLTQILSSYFDTLHIQIESLDTIQNIHYVSGSEKPLPFAERMVRSQGLFAPDLFIDADVLEKLADRSEDRLYEKSLTDIKNTIYQNIYNNLVYIYKTKGTEKAFRNLIRCFGIDDELVKLNAYAGNVEYDIRDNRRTVSVTEKFIDFNTPDNTNATVFQNQNPGDPTNTTGYLPSNTELTGGYAQTLEADILFPLKPSEDASFYFDTNVVSASLFGLHGVVSDESDTTWDPVRDSSNYQVYAVRDELRSDNARFVLTGTLGGFVPALESELFEDVYNNTHWNLAVRIKPEQYPWAGSVAGYSDNYTVELHGVQLEADTVLNEFTVSETITSPAAGFVSGSKRAYVGAHRTNFTGTILQSSDVKVNACRYWLDYLDDKTLAGHAYDTQNYGSLNPHFYAFPFASASFGEVLQADTLVFNWEFSANTGSNTSGEFRVADESSGSSTVATTRFGWAGPTLSKQYTSLGYGFKASSAKVVDKDYILSAKLQLPENIQSSDMVNVLSAQDQNIFTRDSRPINYFFAFEKSMAQAVSVEMINYFATLKDVNNIIGAPVNRYRTEYKGLKILRQRFFERVGNNVIDFEKFYEFYKWFDSSLSTMIQQLIPASADFAENVRTIIESHVLERSKYQHKFQNVKHQIGIIEGTAVGSQTNSEMVASPEDEPQGTALYSMNAFSRRQLGSSQPINFNSWNLIHAPVPVQSLSASQDSKSIWWKSRAERDNLTLSSSFGATNTNKQVLLKSIEKTNTRAIDSIYRFGAGGNRTLGGAGLAANKKTNFVFKATAPFGRGANAAPENVIIGLGSDVEQLINTTDTYHPAFKQRLGFGVNPDANRSGDSTTKGDGNMLAPFSIYSASVAAGTDALVADNYATGTIITNLHHDLVYDNDIPAQGPFTERFVGGRQYRHVPLNQSGSNGVNQASNRPEGWKIEFSGISSSATTEYATPMFGIVPANYDAASSTFYDAEIPTAHALRNVGTKRPVNIQNIKMTTDPVGTNISGALAHGPIGNYQKNYQVVQSNSRRKNDPYFNDQSFNFAIYPETLATRGRFPLYEPDPIVGKSYLFDGSNDFATSQTYTAATWNTLVGSSSAGGTKPYSMSVWIYVNTWTGNDTVMALGRTGFFTGRELRLYDSGGSSLGVRALLGGSGNYKSSDTDMVARQWYHITITYAGMPAAYDGTVILPDIYVNGADDGDAGTANSLADVRDIATDPLQLGISATYNYFDGYMCDVAIYDKELSSAEVTELYNGGQRANPLQSSFAGNTLVYYPMGNLSADDQKIINDLAGNDDLDFRDSPDPAETRSPSNLSGEQFPSLAGPLNKVTANTGGNLNYTLPARTGSASNQTIIVNRYAGSGYEVMSRGYMDPAHEEMSVYNANPYHNLSIRDSGLSGSASVDPLAPKTITVIDQIDKNRGLDQRATLHCGPFGSDAAYGSVAASTYVTTPSYHKTNRNRRRRPEGDLADPGWSIQQTTTASFYDNLFVQHQIPQSEQQYAWITASMASGEVIYGLDAPACISSSTMSQLVTGGVYASSNFVGLQSLILDPVSASSHILGYASDVQASSSYYNSGLGLPISNGADYFNILINDRNGAFGYPTWKQIRTGETKVARSLRKQNLIGQIVPPPIFQTPAGFVQGLKANTFVDYAEQPIASNAKPVFFAFEDNGANPDVANNLTLNVSYQNNLDYFSNEGLNSRLGVNQRRVVNVGTAFNTVADFTLSASLSTIVRYGEQIYPAKTNVYQTRTRTRTEYDISDIWNDVRTLRSVGAYNSQGDFVTDASIWPLDAYTGVDSFAGDGSGTPWSNSANGSGELQSGLTRFTSSAGITSIKPGPQYVFPYFAGITSGEGVLANASAWRAVDSSSNGPPYQPYLDYSEKIRLIGKDMSIVPEFRISEHIKEYIDNNNGNFLTKLDNLFTLTGSVVSNSAANNFYKLYSTTDFMKYFKVVDDELADKTNGNSQPIRRHSIELSCDALLQFLPYKGFYPAERTQELTALLSQSLGTVYPAAQSYAAEVEQSKRIIYEPLIAPGILFNTIKSGIACSGLIFAGTASTSANIENLAGPGTVLTLPNLDGDRLQSRIPYGNLLGRVLNAAGEDSATARGYGISARTLPFEALRDPDAYLGQTSLGAGAHPTGGTGVATGSCLFDTGIAEASLGFSSTSVFIKYDSTTSRPYYKLAIDNFLCETVNFFQTPLKSFVSKPEEEFLAVVKDEYYGMQINLAIPYSASAVGSTINSREFTGPNLGFGMYAQETAFGPVVGLSGSVLNPETMATPIPTCEPWLPPYWYGYANARVIFKSPWTGKVTLDDILGNSVIEYSKISADNKQTSIGTRYQSYADGMDVIRPQITASVNIDTKLLVVPPNTNQQQARWIIQSKFETPVLNFWDAPASNVITGSGGPYQDSSGYKLPSPRGMWHQKGAELTEGLGIFLSLEELARKHNSETYGNIQLNSLSKIVGFQTDKKRIGDFAESKRIEEAIVCVPFLTDKNERKFFDVDKDSQEYVTQMSLLNKYIFPPTFDFLINQTVDPIAFYAFEFGTDFSQDDLINIWQNLPPKSSSTFQKKTATIKIRSLVDRLLDNDEDLQWMVFKVKRRAEKDYNVFTKKGLVDGLPIVEPAIDSPYSYNWPYDYFSLVELIKIDEDVVYATEDLIPADEEETPVVPDLREFIPAQEDLNPRISPKTSVLDQSKGENTTQTTPTRRRRRPRKT